MLEQLKEEVYAANMMLKEYNLVILTWGNVSGIDNNRELVVIKPSGVDYDKMKPADMVVVNLDGKIVEGKLNPSSDTPTHVELYKAFAEIGGVCHTHSTYATAFAQYRQGIDTYGTTHADYFNGAIPCTRLMKKKEIAQNYEKTTGLVIIEALKEIKLSPLYMPAVLVNSHGPFTFGKNAKDSVINSVVLENVADLAYKTKNLFASYKPSLFWGVIQSALLRKHFDRKHGENAYYGQKEDKNQ
jgi:L-ribulose-5-phosphate 4-epimerase